MFDKWNRKSSSGSKAFFGSHIGIFGYDNMEKLDSEMNRFHSQKVVQATDGWKFFVGTYSHSLYLGVLRLSSILIIFGYYCSLDRFIAIIPLPIGYRPFTVMNTIKIIYSFKTLISLYFILKIEFWNKKMLKSFFESRSILISSFLSNMEIPVRVSHKS